MLFCSIPKTQEFGETKSQLNLSQFEPLLQQTYCLFPHCIKYKLIFTQYSLQDIFSLQFSPHFALVLYWQFSSESVICLTALMFSNCNFYHSLPVPLTNPLKSDMPRWFINMYRCDSAFGEYWMGSTIPEINSAGCQCLSEIKLSLV